jgi:hypothetical protein
VRVVPCRTVYACMVYGGRESDEKRQDLVANPILYRQHLLSKMLIQYIARRIGCIFCCIFATTTVLFLPAEVPS